MVLQDIVTFDKDTYPFWLFFVKCRRNLFRELQKAFANDILLQF